MWGEDGQVTDEVATQANSSAAFKVSFENTLYRSPAENPAITYSACLMNMDPQFATVDQTNYVFNFHLAATSPCIDAGKKTGIQTDLDGNLRSEIPDIGCYEFH